MRVSAAGVPPMIMVSRALNCTDMVSEGGLEPFAYLLQSPNDAWLDVRGSA
jgi:hypothetical protein